MKIEDVKNLNLPKNPGCYLFKDETGKIIYVGKAIDLRARVLSYFRASANHSSAKYSMLKQIAKIDFLEVDTEIEALLLEANLIKKHQPYYNIDLRDDKRFLYIKITDDEIPAVISTRKVDRSGRYFGPFTSGIAVKEVLKVVRKIWPYCTEKKVGNKICFYAQIGRCTGVCGGKFDLREYRDQIIKPIILFLEGKKQKIITNYELLIKNYELRIRNLEKEIKLASAREIGKSRNLSMYKTEQESFKKEQVEIKIKVLNIKNILAHARVLSLGDKYAADVVELAKILNLSKVPERIEGYDISNIYGQAAVGSMVVFENGEPNKSEYKKFKIKIEESLGDTGMLREVLERRLKRITHNSQPVTNKQKEEEGWGIPDLIIVDGGKGQLNTILRVLKQFKLDIPVIAVSKGEGLRSAQAPDKVFFPGEKNPLILSLASPALHIIKRVRDEAHRFAIKYHQELRKRKMFGQAVNVKKKKEGF